MTTSRSTIAHLARRTLRMLRRPTPTGDDLQWARSFLSDAEAAIFERQLPADQDHAISVARRFVALRPTATMPEVAGALLHDVGKIDSRLGVFGRVGATIFGGRTRRWQSYRDHEERGGDMLAEGGSDPVTVAIVRGEGPRDALADLRRADDL